jgi:hypothetical protein
VPFGIAMAILLIVSFVAMKVWDYRRLPEPPMAALPPRAHDVGVVPADSVPPITTTTPRATTPVPARTAAIAPDTTSVASTTASTPPAAPPVAPPVAPAVTAPVPVPADARASMMSHFDSLADSLEHTLHNYQDRRTDFAAKRLSCNELAYGYRAADEALVGLAKIAGDTRALDAQRKTRYTGLIAGMDTVNDDFDSSKCKRL